MKRNPSPDGHDFSPSGFGFSQFGVSVGWRGLPWAPPLGLPWGSSRGVGGQNSREGAGRIFFGTICPYEPGATAIPQRHHSDTTAIPQRHHSDTTVTQECARVCVFRRSGGLESVRWVVLPGPTGRVATFFLRADVGRFGPRRGGFWSIWGPSGADFGRVWASRGGF